MIMMAEARSLPATTPHQVDQSRIPWPRTSAAASFRNLALSTCRTAGRANIAYPRRGLRYVHERPDFFVTYGS